MPHQIEIPGEDALGPDHVVDRLKDMLAGERSRWWAEAAENETIARGNPIELSEDEIRMVQAYRRFVATHAPGDAFGWQSPIDDHSIILATAPQLLADPREVTIESTREVMPGVQSG